MARTRIYTGTRASTGARDLARYTGIMRLRREGSRFRPRRTDTIINWGASTGEMGAARVLNPFAAVQRATDKLASLQCFRGAGVPCPEFTTSPEEADGWLREDGLVICRTLLRASAGRGIIVANGEQQLVRAPLYTRYFKGSNEYRIHVAGGEVFDRQMKRRRRDENGETNATNEIRNLENGWVFCRDGVESVGICDDAAREAVRALGLDFGAVDLKCNQQGTRCAVLEVNTAPGLEGSSLDLYAEALVGRLVS